MAGKVVNIKSCSPLPQSCNLTGKYNAFGYYSYTNPYLIIPAFFVSIILNPNRPHLNLNVFFQMPFYCA
jgi:hypothetical protein